jgi:hypothetical protein
MSARRLAVPALIPMAIAFRFLEPLDFHHGRTKFAMTRPVPTM